MDTEGKVEPIQQANLRVSDEGRYKIIEVSQKGRFSRVFIT